MRVRRDICCRPMGPLVPMKLGVRRSFVQRTAKREEYAVSRKQKAASPVCSASARESRCRTCFLFRVPAHKKSPIIAGNRIHQLQPNIPSSQYAANSEEEQERDGCEGEKAKQTTRRQRQGRQSSSSGMRIGSELKGNLWARIAAWLHYRTPLAARLLYYVAWRAKTVVPPAHRASSRQH